MKKESNSTEGIGKQRFFSAATERERIRMAELRNWQLTGFGKKLEAMDGGKKPGIFFTVMSYNVLAQDLVNEHQYLYHQHDRKALIWEVRWRNLLHEINEHKPEVMDIVLYFSVVVYACMLLDYVPPGSSEFSYTTVLRFVEGIR